MNFDLRPKNLHFFSWGVILFIFFLSLLILETKGIFSRFDPSITGFLQTAVSRVFDAPLSVLTLFGNFEPTALLVALIGIWIFKKEKRIYYPLLFFGVIVVFELIGKIFLYHPSPPRRIFPL